eukprot:gene24780-33258_t
MSIFLFLAASASTVSCGGVRVACYVFLPLEKFLFLAAVRFRRSFSSRKDGPENASAPPIPFWWIWAGNVLLEIPTFLMSVGGLAVTTVGADDDGNSSNWRCSFNHISTEGIALDIITYQGPLVLTVIVCVYLYFQGLVALKDTPFSVQSRHMSRASGYFVVLVAVWMPNLVYNILSIQYRVNSGFIDLEDVVDIVTASQGFLNVLVYIGSNRNIRRWFLYNLTSFKLFRILMGITEPLLVPEIDRAPKNAMQEKDDGYLDEGDGVDIIVGTPTVNPVVFSRHNSSTVGSSQMPPILKGANNNLTGNARSRSKIGVDFSDIDKEKFVRFGKDEVKVLAPNIERESNSMCDFPVPRDDEDLELSKHVGWVVDKEYNGGKALQSDREPKEDDNEEESDAV